MTTPYRKKLIEVALPLEAINREAAREKSIRHGHPSTLHLWWARRPLAVCRAVIFASLVDDPGSRPDLWPTVEAQERKRQELFRLIEELVKWENSNNERVLKAAREEILRSTDGNPPPVYDPFCGGGSIPLEAQRLGLESNASDLNPVPVLITKALIELPPKFAERPAVNPEARGEDWSHRGAKAQENSKETDSFALVRAAGWKGASGLAADIRYYGRWLRDEAARRIGHLYPNVQIVRVGDGTYRYGTPAEMAAKKVEERTVIAWLWARTVASPNPAARGVHVPLVSTFWLSKKPGKETWLTTKIVNGMVVFEVAHGKPSDPAAIDRGTKAGRGAAFICALTGVPIPPDYIREEGVAGRMNAQLMAVVAEGERSRIYLPPTQEIERIASDIKPTWKPTGAVPERLTGGTCFGYGLREWGDLFSERQLVALDTLAELIALARERISKDALV